MMQVEASSISAVYVWDGVPYLSWDDAEDAFNAAGEEGYNGMPELVSSDTTGIGMPKAGRIWVDSYGFYPNRGSCEDFNGAKLIFVSIQDGAEVAIARND